MTVLHLLPATLAMSRRGIVEHLSSKYVISPHLSCPLTSAVRLYSGPILNIFTNRKRLKCSPHSIYCLPLRVDKRLKYYWETPTRQLELLSEQVGLY